MGGRSSGGEGGKKGGNAKILNGRRSAEERRMETDEKRGPLCEEMKTDEKGREWWKVGAREKERRDRA